MYAGDETITLD
ncbi:hypothetical protein ENH_00005960 [Eimeria necatrix]|nr:hypothetical protein ENH_00005960 [Eimeria necatrix]CDJ65498.1 hypothetical protein ENH_00005960 [Eimeria necatrix]